MTAFVSPERATAASSTGAIGLLILAIAVVMMVIAAPTHYGAHNPAKPSAVQLTTDLCRQLTSRSDSTTVYACLAGPFTRPDDPRA